MFFWEIFFFLLFSLWKIKKEIIAQKLGEEHLNGSYFVLNPLCNLGFFMHTSSIFLASLNFFFIGTQTRNGYQDEFETIWS